MKGCKPKVGVLRELILSAISRRFQHQMRVSMPYFAVRFWSMYRNQRTRLTNLPVFSNLAASRYSQHLLARMFIWHHTIFVPGFRNTGTSIIWNSVVLKLKRWWQMVSGTPCCVRRSVVWAVWSGSAATGVGLLHTLIRCWACFGYQCVAVKATARETT